MFDLSNDYVLIADMDCVHRKKGNFTNTHGHLYIFNKCLAFYAKGTRAIVLPYNRISDLKKSKAIVDKLKAKIKVFMDDGAKYGFKRIKHRDTAY